MRKRIAVILAVLILSLAAALVLTACSQAGSDIPAPTGVAAETTQTSVFYSTGRSLFEERRVIDAKDPYAETLRVLLAAQPDTDKNVAIVQPQAHFNGVKLKDGVLTIDWKPDVLGFEAEPNEKFLAFGSILRTFGEFSEVQKVSFTVDGKTSGSADGKDIQAFWGRVSLKGQPWPVIRREAGKTTKLPTGGASAAGAGH